MKRLLTVLALALATLAIPVAAQAAPYAVEGKKCPPRYWSDTSNDIPGDWQTLESRDGTLLACRLDATWSWVWLPI